MEENGRFEDGFGVPVDDQLDGGPGFVPESSEASGSGSGSSGSMNGDVVAPVDEGVRGSDSGSTSGEGHGGADPSASSSSSGAASGGASGGGSGEAGGSTANPGFGGAFGPSAGTPVTEGERLGALGNSLGGGIDDSRRFDSPENSSNPDREDEIGNGGKGGGEHGSPLSHLAAEGSREGGGSGAGAGRDAASKGGESGSGSFDPADHAHGSADASKPNTGDAGGDPSTATKASGTGDAGSGTSGLKDPVGDGSSGASPVAGVGDSVGDGVMPAAGGAGVPGAAAGAAGAGGAGGLGAVMANGMAGAAFGGVQVLRGALSLLGRGGSSLASATGGRISSFTGASVIGGAGSLLTLALVAPLFTGGPNIAVLENDDDVVSCSTNVKNAANALTDSLQGGDISAQAEEVGKKIAAVLYRFGMNDTQVAGAFGNMQVESGVDPTSIQGVLTEPYNINGPLHQARINDTSAGIGIIQWTPENPKLRAYAKAQGKNWWDLDVQLKFLTDPSGNWAPLLRQYMNANSGSVQDAARDYMNIVERPAADSSAERGRYGAQWMTKIADWKSSGQIDQNYANSILAQAGVASENAGQDGVAKAAQNCTSATGTNGNNSSLAEAAVSYAWPFYDQSVQDITKGQNNRGTPLYQNLHLAIWKSNNYGTNPLASCDNGVSTAVRWSGSDKDFPEQSSNTILDYLKGAGTNTGTWKEIPWDDNVSTLQPGDILSKYGHILMYVGKDAPLKFYNNDTSKFEPNGDMVSASHSGNGGATTPNTVDRSPGIGVTQRGAPYYTKADGYHVFRLQHKTGSEFESLKPSSTVIGAGDTSGK